MVARKGGGGTRKPRAAARKEAASGLVVADEAKAEILPPAVGDEIIDQVVEKLNGLQREHGLNLVLAMGEFVLDSFYKGDLEAWRARGTRDASLRKLAKHPDLQVSASVVYRSVETYVLVRRLGSPEWKHLTTTHVRSVLGLSEDHQQKLLTQAEDKAWDTDKLEAEAAKVRRQYNDGRGRPPLPRFQKSLQQMGKLFADPDDSFGDTEKLDQLEDEVALSLFKTVTDAKAKIDELQKQLQRRVRGLAG